LTSPLQSQFRVFALLIVDAPNTGIFFIEGTNSEPGYIGGSICAERSALVKLRFIEKPRILKVVVVTDHFEPVSPGALCREFLISFAAADTSIVMGNSTGSSIAECQLQQLFPYPPLYGSISRVHFHSFTAKFAPQVVAMGALGPDWLSLYEYARALARYDTGDSLHPLRLAAAVALSDGTMEGAWQLKGAEYGCTLDPVTQLVSALLRRCSSVATCPTGKRATAICSACRSSPLLLADVASTSARESVTIEPPYASSEIDDLTCNNVSCSGGQGHNFSAASLASDIDIRPLRLIMTDQFGVAHAPFAQARALLTEYGFGHLQVAIHDEAGALHIVSAADLLPSPPGGGVLLSHDNF
jgi:cytidine deaminase